MDNKFDIVIIGGGHAGLEAAWIASQFNLRVGILTLPGIPIASAPCNPAVGGVGKGQVVRELDALGGIMGKLADLSAIQYRTLNESKGYAVQSTRVQIDKVAYAENAERAVEVNKNISVIRCKVNKVIKSNELFHVETSVGDIESRSVVCTTGTFLAGNMHTGEEQTAGGRVDCEQVDSLDSIFASVSKLKTRFKTGTPARIKRKSIDFSKMESQPSDKSAINFHFDHDPYHRELEQVSCHLTRTNDDTLKIIRDNKERSPIFNGQIKGVGPRYCPSIEDKAYRYEEKNEHHVFVEPESLSLDTFYPNGISTSLPKEIQLDFIQTIAGLENAEIAVWGYAVEYDVVDTTKLDITLQSTEVPGLYFAGQVNGTSGYEEAAGQGYIAGVNAALKLLDREKLVLDRNESYIGVMIEDLVSNKRDEPYRLFTARSENRLFVREDNTIQRISPYRSSLGLNSKIDKYQMFYMEQFYDLYELCRTFTFVANRENKALFERYNFGSLKTNISMAELIKRSKLDPVKTLSILCKEFCIQYSSEIIRTTAITLKYDGYIDRAKIEQSRIARLDNKKINWKNLSESENVSFECRTRIKEIMPESFGQLKRIEGIRPATLVYVANNLV